MPRFVSFLSIVLLLSSIGTAQGAPESSTASGPAWDLAVVSLEVSPDQGLVLGEPSRLVTVTFANVGSTDVPEYFYPWVRVYVTHPDSPTWGARALYVSAIDLRAGERLEVQLEWDTTGEVGPATVHAEVRGVIDGDSENNRMQVHTYVWRDDVPVGIDGLNHWILTSKARAAVVYNNEGTGVYADAWLPTSSFWIEAGVLSSGDLIAHGCAYAVLVPRTCFSSADL